MAVKMIKLGSRDCIVTHEHVIPVDLFCGATYEIDMLAFDVKKEERAVLRATIYKGMPNGAIENIVLDAEEGKQLRTMLARMVA